MSQHQRKIPRKRLGTQTKCKRAIKLYASIPVLFLTSFNLGFIHGRLTAAIKYSHPETERLRHQYAKARRRFIKIVQWWTDSSYEEANQWVTDMGHPV